MFTTKTYYVIANKNGEFFSYDKMTGGKSRRVFAT